MALAAAGATVIATGRREDRLAELEGVIAAAGGTAHPSRVDMTDADSIVTEHKTISAMRMVPSRLMLDVHTGRRARSSRFDTCRAGMAPNGA